MTRKSTPRIFSISGQLEALAARDVIKEHGCREIPLRDFPPGVAKVDDAGRPVRFAIVMSPAAERRFDELLDWYRA